MSKRTNYRDTTPRNGEETKAYHKKGVLCNIYFNFKTDEMAMLIPESIRTKKWFAQKLDHRAEMFHHKSQFQLQHQV